MREPEPVRDTVAHALFDACEADAVVEGETSATVGDTLAEAHPLRVSVDVDAAESEMEPVLDAVPDADGELAPEAVKDSVPLADTVRVTLSVPDTLLVVEPEKDDESVADTHADALDETVVPLKAAPSEGEVLYVADTDMLNVDDGESDRERLGVLLVHAVRLGECDVVAHMLRLGVAESVAEAHGVGVSEDVTEPDSVPDADTDHVEQ